MIRTLFLIVILTAIPALAQGASGGPAEPSAEAQAELQAMRQAMQQMQDRLDTLIAETQRLRSQAEAAQEPAPPAESQTADDSDPMQRIAALLEDMAERQRKLDVKLGVVEARQRDLQGQFTTLRVAQEVDNRLNDPYEYRRNEAPAQTAHSVPQTTVHTTAQPTVVSAPVTYATTYTTAVQPTGHNVVYTNRYVYPQVWHGRAHVVHRRHYYPYWRGHCGWYGGYHYWPRYRSGFYGGLKVRTGNVCFGLGW